MFVLDITTIKRLIYLDLNKVMHHSLMEFQKLALIQNENYNQEPHSLKITKTMLPHYYLKLPIVCALSRSCQREKSNLNVVDTNFKLL